MVGRKNGKGSRHSRDEWQLVMAKYGSSGLGVAAFCEREAISAASFYRWRSLLGNAGDRGKVVGSDATPAFVDLGTLTTASPPGPRIDLKLDLGDGLVLHLVRH